MSKEYVTTIQFPVEYTQIPQNKLFQNAPKKQIDLVVKSSGFKIVRTKFSNDKIELSAKNLKNKKGDLYYFLTRNQTQSIQKQLISGVELREVLQDSLFLNLGLLKTKKVPIKSNLDINFHIGYDITKKITLKPDSILISGPELNIDSIHFVELQKFTLNDVKTNFAHKIDIQKINGVENIKYNINEVTISGKVEKFTEDSFSIPFEITNLPENINITTLSKTVAVTFVVALSEFNNINEDSFQVECDYRMSEKNNLNYLIPKIVLKPEVLKSVKIVPNKIDFLIQK